MQVTLLNLLNRIKQSHPTEIDDILTTLSRRYTELYPNWELIILALPKENSEERRQILTRILEYEQMRREGQ